MCSIVTVVRIYLFSFGVFCVMAGIYYLLQDSAGFDRMMHGKSPKKQEKQRSLEDFIVSMQRVCHCPNAVLNDYRCLPNTRLCHRFLREKSQCRQFCTEWVPYIRFWNVSSVIHLNIPQGLFAETKWVPYLRILFLLSTIYVK